MYAGAKSIAGVALVLMLAGCAVTRSELKVGAEPPATPAASATGKPIVIGSVVDARRFEAAPKDPSVPSLGTEGGGDEVKARAIGRKRNTYGMALGDVTLEPGNTVANVVRRQLAVALGEAGYRVVGPGTDKSAPVVDVRIHQFWSWFTPGFWTITLETIISTDLNVAGRTGPVPVTVRTSESSLAATDGMWLEAIDKALVRWRAEVITHKTELP